MATLSDIRTKLRKLTARDSTQMSDQEADSYINNYYKYSLPADLQILKLEDLYVMQTQPNVDVYAFDSENYTYVEAPLRVGGYPAAFFSTPAEYYAIRPQYTYVQQIASGDGTSGPYTGTITSTPFHRSFNSYNNQATDPNESTFPNTYPIGVRKEVIISAEISDSYNLVVNDTPTLVSGSGLTARYADTGTLIGDVTAQLSGSINYMTGDVEVTFSDNIPAGNPIYASVYVYAAARPRYALFFQNQIQLSPVPDNSYIVEFKAYRSPTALINNNSPELNELWELLAVGAALKVFEDNGDMGSYASIMPLLDKYESLVRTRGLIQRTRNRVPTIYSSPAAGAGQSGTFFYNGF